MDVDGAAPSAVAPDAAPGDSAPDADAPALVAAPDDTTPSATLGAGTPDTDATDDAPPAAPVASIATVEADDVPEDYRRLAATARSGMGPKHPFVIRKVCRVGTSVKEAFLNRCLASVCVPLLVSLPARVFACVAL
jgi:hypothetical protein